MVIYLCLTLFFIKSHGGDVIVSRTDLLIYSLDVLVWTFRHSTTDQVLNQFLRFSTKF